MPRLNQIIAVEKGIKTRSHTELTEAHHALQKPALLSGISRSYRPKDEEGEQLPPEATRVQARAEEVIRKTADILVALFDVTATKDYSNSPRRVQAEAQPQLERVRRQSAGSSPAPAISVSLRRGSPTWQRQRRVPVSASSYHSRLQHVPLIAQSTGRETQSSDAGSIPAWPAAR